jgi:hypothetical protein
MNLNITPFSCVQAALAKAEAMLMKASPSKIDKELATSAPVLTALEKSRQSSQNSPIKSQIIDTNT